MSEATKNSPSPRPTTIGGPLRTATIFSGSSAEMQHEREEAAHEHQRPPHGVLEPVGLHLALDQVRDDLGVGLGDELVPLALELVLQIEVVLDDAVVDDDDLAGAVAVRMGVLLGRPAVRRPPRVADAVVARDRVQRDDVLEPRELAGAAPQLDGAVVHDRDARRVVAAVFEPPQPVDEHRDDFLGSDVSDNPAHCLWPHSLRLRRARRPRARLLSCSFYCSFFSTQPSMFRCLPALTASAPGGTFLADGRAAADVGALADRDRRDELRVAADERAVFDHVVCFFTPS